MERCALAPGDMFSSVPAGADAYIMKHIIHDWADDLWVVITTTGFGQVVLLQLLLLVATGLALGRNPSVGRWRIGLVLGTTATIMEVGHDHAFAMATGLSFLEISQALHLWAAGAWLGGVRRGVAPDHHPGRGDHARPLHAGL